MTKSDLVDAIASGAGLTKKAAGEALEAFISSVSSTLAKGGQVTITGFGTFRVSNRAARRGHNPRTGQSIQIAASKAPTFRAGKNLKSAVN